MKHRLLQTILVVALAGLFVFPAHAAIQFSGTSFTTTINTTGVKQDLINSIETALLNGGAGWTTISGSTTADLLMESGTTPQGLQIRCRIKDNGGNGIQLYLENVAGTLVDTETQDFGATLMATGGRTYQVIGSTYQFVIYQPGVDRAFVWVGMPYLPAFMSAFTQCGWLFSGNIRDNDNQVRETLNVAPTIARPGSGANNWEVMVDAAYWSNANSQNNPTSSVIGPPRLILNGVSADLNMILTSATSYRWGDDSVVTGDVYTAWGLTANNVESKLRGQIWDAIYIADSVAINTTAVFSTHTFQNVTDNNPGLAGNYPRGGIWFAVN